MFAQIVSTQLIHVLYLIGYQKREREQAFLKNLQIVKQTNKVKKNMMKVFVNRTTRNDNHKNQITTLFLTRF